MRFFRLSNVTLNALSRIISQYSSNIFYPLLLVSFRGKKMVLILCKRNLYRSVEEELDGSIATASTYLPFLCFFKIQIWSCVFIIFCFGNKWPFCTHCYRAGVFYIQEEKNVWNGTQLIRSYWSYCCILVVCHTFNLYQSFYIWLIRFCNCQSVHNQDACLTAKRSLYLNSSFTLFSLSLEILGLNTSWRGVAKY